MVIDAKMEQALNGQIQAEFESAYLYLSMSAWFEANDLPGCAHWMRKQAGEEQEHAMKLYKYVAARGGRVVLENGRTYYSSSIILKPGVDLHLERGSVLKAHSDLSTYFHPNGGEKDDGVERVGTPVTLKPSYAFIYAKEGFSVEALFTSNTFAAAPIRGRTVRRSARCGPPPHWRGAALP